MLEIRYISEADKTFWFALDRHMSQTEFVLKIRDRRGYIILNKGTRMGVMRYNFLWDSVPFLTLIYFNKADRGKGYGRQAILFWEDEMRKSGHSVVMTSTQVDEEAQHFYRKLGYQDRGSLFLDNTPLEQPQEIFMLKVL